MAAEWILCSSGFIEADVIRWTEGVWRKPRRNRGRAINTGDRVVIAEVIRDDGKWLDLLVRDCSVTRETTAHPVVPLEKNAAVRRKRHTVVKGKPERLLWSDETVRAALVSRLLAGDNSSEEESSP
jgi:hypothetical protein